ncbi:LOW QUALITY PROTEIN: tumor necrosis factor receptor superfamily member 14-like [Rousettus aegyptiacus]|uniref:LOW QUALITY PROTEIN: tumor necrosis factor receptor superfamily member 14-like n=1 Tax=Rousettus aegyptiacus TaxID=9407 RepID=UPI00168CFD85|nr:LOW QUALITY PROTEIN: tumor necrosis factor receptor superfamily member 14-like [Rousettus aegyptiacus]
MQRVPGGGLQPWSPAPLADTLSLALCLLLLGCLHCALAMSPCKEDEYPVGAECCPKCKPGYRVNQPCWEDCVPCDRGTYTAHPNGLSECLQCQVCDPAMGLETRRKCFSTNNTVCGCDQGHICVTEEGDNCAKCRPHRVCGPGQRVQERGTERRDTECADCPPGTFSPGGTLAQCQPWTQCSGWFQMETEPGTQSTDATCSSSWGFYLLCVFSVFSVIVVALVLVLWITVKSRRSCGLCAPTRARLQVEEDTATRPSRLSPACCSPSEPQLPVRGTGLLTPPPGWSWARRPGM